MGAVVSVYSRGSLVYTDYSAHAEPYSALYLLLLLLLLLLLVLQLL
jgi:hypothetical protein